MKVRHPKDVKIKTKIVNKRLAGKSVLLIKKPYNTSEKQWFPPPPPFEKQPSTCKWIAVYLKKKKTETANEKKIFLAHLDAF